MGLAYKRFDAGPHKKGDWILSSDGWVLQITWYKDYSNTPSERRRCSHMYNTSIDKNFTDLNRTYNADPENYAPRYQRGSGLSRLEKFILDQFLKGVPLDEAIKSVTFSTNVKVKARALLRKKSAQGYILANLEEILDKAGATKEKIIEGILKLAESDSTVDSVRLSSWLGLAKFHGMGEEAKGIGELTEKRVVRLSGRELRELEAEKRYKLQLGEGTSVTVLQDNEADSEVDFVSNDTETT